MVQKYAWGSMSQKVLQSTGLYSLQGLKYHKKLMETKISRPKLDKIERANPT